MSPPEQGAQIALAETLLGAHELGVHRLAVHRSVEVAEDPEARGLVRTEREVREPERQRRSAAGLMHDDAIGVDLGGLLDLQASVVAHDHALRALVEDDRFAVGEPDLVVHALGLLAQQVERAVVEDVAVLVDLDERGAAVGGRLPEHLGQVLAVVVDRSGDERALGAECDGDRVERVIDRAERGRLRDLPLLARRRVLPLH